MRKSFEVTAGRPHPLGANLDKTGCNFSVHSPKADAVTLCLFKTDTEEEITSIKMPAKTGKVWHCHVRGIEAGQLYGYRTHGKNIAETGQCFDSEKLLIDPYAKMINRAAVWSARQYASDSHFMIPKSVVLNSTASNRERPQKPKIPLANTVIYEAHVKGLTKLHPQVPVQLQGKYLGVSHPAVLEHLTGLGVTSVQLLPVMAFMPEPYIAEKGLTNYWGYNPINFFSPEPRYANEDAVTEFKQMVDELHAAGLEVILDVVYNHTAEGGDGGPILSFKGFDNTSFYLFERNEYGAIDYQRYINNSGCGNSVNSAFPYVLKMVMDSLRYWVTEMGVDGFRFDLAASLGRDPYEFSSLAGFFRTVRQDPVLAAVKLIAEPWDIGYGGYRLGQFPSNWQEVNDKYRDTVRAFWRGDTGVIGEFATRIMGSRDLFIKELRSINTSVNNITYHDGFTLHDLVSFNEKHNEANGESNRDGHGHNLSCNYGEEGDTHDNNILNLREKQKRNLFATLMLSQGIPHMLGGDEIGRSQGGNNNAYCQDNETSWINWELNKRQQDFYEFCAYVIRLRQSSQILHQLMQKDDSYSLQTNVDKIRWYRPDGHKKAQRDWQDPQNKAFAVEIRGTKLVNFEHWLLIFNAFDEDVSFSLPELEKGCYWSRELDTQFNRIGKMHPIMVSKSYLQVARSVSVFTKTRAGRGKQATV